MSLSARLRQNAGTFPERTFIVEEQREVTFLEALELAESVAAHLSTLDIRQVYFRARDSATLIIGLAAAEMAGVTSCVLADWHSERDLGKVVEQVGNGHLFTDQLAQRFPSAFDEISDIATMLDRGRADDAGSIPRPTNADPQPGRVIILSSGTTGAPKPILYTWSRLLQQVRHIDPSERHVWLLTYPLNHFAGIQMLLHTLANGQTLVIPPSRRFEDVLAAIEEHGVSAISGTPTFWRVFAGRLSGQEDKSILLEQVTLGGEVTTAELLSDLQRLFPEAVITQIYATTELGSCFAVKDGRPGFPVEFLERRAGNVDLKIVDGELYVRSENKMIGYAGQEHADEAGWMATGDLVEIQGNRVVFRGRKCQIINVGGVKVRPLKVETAILQVDGVRAARVYGKDNPVTGKLVAAEIEVAHDHNHQEVIEKVREICRRRLSRYEQPRVISITEHIPRRNQKIARREY
jgi:acyl-CoA synthetase (AMP-forming)/AMP-acid ligase II